MEEDGRSDSGVSTLRSDGARSSGDERSGSRSSALSDERAASRPSASEPDIKIVGSVPGRGDLAHYYARQPAMADPRQLAGLSPTTLASRCPLHSCSTNTWQLPPPSCPHTFTPPRSSCWRGSDRSHRRETGHSGRRYSTQRDVDFISDIFNSNISYKAFPRTQNNEIYYGKSVTKIRFLPENPRLRYFLYLLFGNT